ncbi:MAG: NUDIX domain-containing protein [Planctomycetes bacterium]|nr:NUDIX domain-containing protein [Planctomycetota bacterium]
MAEFYKLKKLTNCRWLNYFDIVFQRDAKARRKWHMCSRKENPIADAHKPDAVVIVPIIKTDQGNRLVVTKEFRVPIWDYEYGFPAGLIDAGEDIAETVKRELKEETGLKLVKINHVSRPVYSSAGMSDESCVMALVEAAGEFSNQWLEDAEDIETLLMDIEQIRALLASDKKISAKAWGLFYHYALAGEIE